MKFNFKKSIYVLTISSALFLQGCGVGDTVNPDGGGGDELPAGETFKYNRISIAGSSITWGKGYLGEKSYVGEVIKYFREDVADSVGPGELPTPNNKISDLMSYKGELYVYNSGSVISGTLEASDEVSIVFAGSGVDTTVEMEVDGTVCGRYTIRGSFKPVKVTSPDNEVDAESGNVRSFRETEPRSVSKICTNLTNKEHDFKLTVKSGALHLNFITNHMYYFQNAGIGGYAASTILGEPAWFPNTTTDEVVDFDPDFFIFESATNDANTWDRENQGKASTNVWKIESPIACIIENNIVKGLSTSGIVAGDVVVLGDYRGDIRNMAVGIVKNINGNDIVLDSNVVHSYEDNITNCRVKDITSWTDNVKEVVKRVKDGVGHSVTIGIGTSGVPNYYASNGQHAGDHRFPRRLMGYREKGIIMANENGWMFYDFFNKVKAFNPGVEYNLEAANRWSYGDNTHPNEENGYRLFGAAITDVLKTK